MPFRTLTSAFGLAAALSCIAVPASARNIVIGNDDGLTSNVVALYQTLTEAGHDVIVSVPCSNQSGMGASAYFGRPLAPLAAACLNDAAKPGEPGAGPMTRSDLPPGDFYYVSGTPVMALLYGLDVAAMDRWGGPPDLVLSGPNEGQNVGAIILSSGTVSNVQYAAMRGIPAIALSAGIDTEDHDLADPLSPEIARLTVKLVTALDTRSAGGKMLPQGLALNVNFPDEPTGAGWQLSRIGSYNAYKIGFTNNLAASAPPEMLAAMRERGMEMPPLPGISISVNNDPPLPEQEQDESIVSRTHIAVSPMQAGYAALPAGEAFVSWQLADLFATDQE